jgi:hypothetical protein
MQLMFKPSQAGNSGNSGPSLKPFKDLFIIYNLFIFYNPLKLNNNNNNNNNNKILNFTRYDFFILKSPLWVHHWLHLRTLARKWHGQT